MDGIVWYSRPGQRVAHAFTDGPGWRRSACRGVHFSVLLLPVRNARFRCASCMVALRLGVQPGSLMGETEAREAFGR